jgi:alpha-amylase
MGIAIRIPSHYAWSQQTNQTEGGFMKHVCPVTRAAIFICAILSLISPIKLKAYEDLSDYAASVASNEYAELISNYLIDDLDTLESFFVAGHHDPWMYEGPVPPGTEAFSVNANPILVPIDWSALPSGFTSELVGTTNLGVAVYPVVMQENETNQQVQYLVGTNLIYTMSTTYTNTWRYATNAVPDLYGGGYSTDEVAYIEGMYAPSRILLSVYLIEDVNLYTYLYNEAFLSGTLNASSEEDLEDSDGDGASNRDEVRWGTDPYDAGDFPGITAIETGGGNITVYWPAPSNRNYQVERSDDLIIDSWATASSWLSGNNSNLNYAESSGASNRFLRYQIEEEDINSNGLPDWWEVNYWGGLTTNTPSGDNDEDGLDNGEELYFGYSPLISERAVIHSVYHSAIVNFNSPATDDGTERFDFHGGGRPLGLAQGSTQEAWGGSQATLYGQINTNAGYRTFHSGGAFFNNDDDMLYIGIYGMERETDNAWVLFIDSNAGGVTNLRHLSGQPSAIGNAKNILFDAAQFTPNAALILGARDADGRNYSTKSINGNEVGQGVYDLATGGDFAGFNSTSGGCYISQWSQGASEDSPNGGVEVALSLDELGCQPGGTIKVAAVLVGGTSSSNRWVSPLVYGANVSPSGGGFQNQTIIGAPVILGSAEESLPNPGYPGFSDDDVLLQGFYWNTTPIGQWWKIFQTYNLVDAISQAGFSLVWLPPAYKGSNAGGSVGYDVYDHYDLGQYYQAGGTFTKKSNTLYGTRSELEWLIGSLKSNGVVVIEDVVLNHMVGGANGGYTYTNYPAHADAPQFYKTASDFHPSTNGHADTMFPYHNDYGFSYAPNQSYSVDIDHLVPNMRLGLKAWGNWLAETAGFEGWRLDLTQGVEPWYVWEWLHYRNIRPGFAFMEYWEPANGREMQEWLDLTGRKAAIYDSHLRDLFKQMCESGDTFDMRELIAPSLLGLEPAYTIVYVDNHDTSREADGTKMGIREDKPLAYAYAFHSEGLPMVFWRDYFDGAYINASSQLVWGTELKGEINRLIKIRQLAVGGRLTVLHADANVYAQERAGSDSKHKSVLVINDSTSTLTNTIQTTWFNTVLVDLVSTSGSPHSVTSSLYGVATFAIPPETCLIYATTNALNEVNNP